MSYRSKTKKLVALIWFSQERTFSATFLMCQECRCRGLQRKCVGANEEDAQTKKATSTRRGGKERAAATDELDNVIRILKEILKWMDIHDDVVPKILINFASSQLKKSFSQTLTKSWPSFDVYIKKHCCYARDQQ